MAYDVETPGGASDGSGGSGGVVGTSLAAALSERGGQVVSLLAPGVLLVAAPPGVAEAVAAEAGAELAELGPQQRTAPEWGPLLSQAPAEAGTGGLPLQRRRRALSGGGDREAAAARVEALSRLQTFLPAAVPGGLEHERRRRRHLAEAVEPPPLYELSVQLLPVLTTAAVEAAEADWPAALAAAMAATAEEGSAGGGLGVCAPLVAAPRGPDGGAVVSARSLHVFVCEQDIGPAVRWLASQPVVRWVAPQHWAGSDNARASTVMQTGDLNNAQYYEPLGLSLAEQAARRPYWEAGLDGRGEIVGVGDTGLDLSHCHFADPRWSAADIAGSMNRSAPGGDPHWRPGPGAHRKLVQYWLAPGAAMGDAPDEGGGHGTHVAGSVAGVCLLSMDPYGNGTRVLTGPDAFNVTSNTANSTDPHWAPLSLDIGTGQAPRAKLSIVDFGRRFIPGVPSTLRYPMQVPRPVDSSYLPLHAGVGACITSDSWSEDTNVYDTESQGFDRFLWRNPDVVSFTSAGNNGTDALTRGGSIGTPANAKNVIAVGATVRTPATGRWVCQTLLVRGYRRTAYDGVQMSMHLWPKENDNLPDLDTLLVEDQETRLTVADPLDACTPLNNSRTDTEGAVVLVKRSNCSYAEQVAAVEAAGGVAVIIINNLPDMMRAPPDPVLPNGTLATRLPTSAVPQGVGDWLLGNVTSGLLLRITSSREACDIRSIWPMSSYGPTPDGRIKPDIVAPGRNVMSASARNTTDSPGGGCFGDTERKSGTSMATPQASGGAALMRQYFRQGFYPAGDPTAAAAAPFTPSGMLIKALIIAGAQDLAGGLIMALGSRLGPAPHPYQGWGRMDLSRSLPLKSPGGQAQAGPSTGPNMTLADRANFTAAGQQLVLTGINATGQGPITIVLVWYDFAADLDSTVQLVNDLDLEVALGSDSPAPDRVNTVERVLLSSPPAGAPLTVTVRAASLPSALLTGDPDAAQPQRFAVVALGAFRGGFESALNPAFVRAQQQMEERKKPPPKLPPKRNAVTFPSRRKPPPQRAPPPRRRQQVPPARHA
ncbi:hypothetical protein HYH03_006436 [Edaphochlamys debaryana]|uniref:Subtilisin n=1 Tax=Edaphochlamys debaryana TaxID=47281 RepID=A0A836C137_9CHLO|nr:hypothetical protein HYH03_006436 [Edaphochlamys debaryana]|eukprot:KAG2495492.1 hypothetical protein HYH03_006436 [Edaphochlamys debaryana]